MINSTPSAVVTPLSNPPSIPQTCTPLNHSLTPLSQKKRPSIQLSPLPLTSSFTSQPNHNKKTHPRKTQKLKLASLSKIPPKR